MQLNKVTFFREDTLPGRLYRKAGAFYLIENEGEDCLTLYVTDNNKNARPVINKELIQQIINNSDVFNSNTLTNYRSDYISPYIYSGYIINDTVNIIKRCLEGLEEFANNITDFETDWNNRENLTYN